MRKDPDGRKQRERSTVGDPLLTYWRPRLQSIKTQIKKNIVKSLTGSTRHMTSKYIILLEHTVFFGPQ